MVRKMKGNISIRNFCKSKISMGVLCTSYDQAKKLSSELFKNNIHIFDGMYFSSPEGTVFDNMGFSYSLRTLEKLEFIDIALYDFSQIEEFANLAENEQEK